MIATATADIDSLNEAVFTYLDTLGARPEFQHSIEHVTQLLNELLVIDEDVVSSTNGALDFLRTVLDAAGPGAGGVLVAGLARISRDGGKVRASYRCPIGIAEAMTDMVAARERRESGLAVSQDERDTRADLLAARMVRLQVYAASFYYRAHRLASVLSELPRLSRVKPPGVINVRNQLIEHNKDDKPHGAWKWRFAVDVDAGPIFETGEAFHDAGYVKNRAEFLEVLTAKCREQAPYVSEELARKNAADST